MWAALDKNIDNVWQYAEFPHPDWTRANRDGDDSLSWKEELANKTFRRQAKTSEKICFFIQKRNGPINEAWNNDRPDCKTLFTFIDWNNDGKITAAEYEIFDTQVKSYNDESYPKTNDQGETGMEVFLRLSGLAKQAGKRSSDAEQGFVMKITLAFDLYGTLMNTHGVVSLLEDFIGVRRNLLTSLER